MGVFKMRLGVIAFLMLVIPVLVLAQSNPGFIDGATLCADYPNTNCSNDSSPNPLSLNQAFMNKLDVSNPTATSYVATAEAPSVAAGQVGYGATVVLPGAGTCPTGIIGGAAVIGCIVVNVSGTARNVPYF